MPSLRRAFALALESARETQGFFSGASPTSVFKEVRRVLCNRADAETSQVASPAVHVPTSSLAPTAEAYANTRAALVMTALNQIGDTTSHESHESDRRGFLSDQKALEP
eukprot:TRINITY_DN18929_c0_g1_i1.p2 TRINITY_DN18929_c0_g1~~TRINITY_DN18929_c0_g1_i1.p2  ORF type:complete len:109 (+),score=14.57 TRINITY_DN18929_c0_g1_i1:300-626(+)